MSVHLHREIESLMKSILSLAAMVESQVEKAIRALKDRDEKLAHEVESGDAQIDHQEIEVEEECLKIMALYQPVAIDLRRIVAVLKINKDLERIGDLAVNIAHKAAALSYDVLSLVPFDMSAMWAASQAMLRESIDAMVYLDVPLAESVCSRDNKVDLMKHEVREKIEELVKKNPGYVPDLLRLLAVSRNLERIADCATNIAEDVIYLVEGRIVRHINEHF